MEKGYYTRKDISEKLSVNLSQSTIKMEKGYYVRKLSSERKIDKSQSTIKMEKGYYGYLLHYGGG